MFKSYNPNPEKKIVRDCTVRAISKALNQSWEKTFLELCDKAYKMHDMPDADCVWGAYLKSKGFKRRIISNCCSDRYTVKDFCNDNPEGEYILALSGHVVSVRNGDYYDTWDSGEEIPIYVWRRV